MTQGALAELINALGTAFGLMLGMTGSCCTAAAHLHHLRRVGGNGMIMGRCAAWLLSIIAAGLVLSILYALLPKGRLPARSSAPRAAWC